MSVSRWVLCACVVVGTGVWSGLQAAEREASPEGAPVGEVSAEQPGVQSLLPPEDSPELLRTVQLAFPTQGNVPSIAAETYLYYMTVQQQLSLPSQDKWMPYTEETEQLIREDFRVLWDTGFLNDIWIEVVDEPWENGVMGKRVVFNLEERERVKFVTFDGSEAVDRGDIETAMQENGMGIRVDSFLDQGLIKRVKGLVKFMFADKGYQFAEIEHEVTALPGGPRTVQLTFHLDEGPKVIVEKISFVGNEAMSDGTLRGQMKNTKERWWLSWITKRGTYKEAQFEEDADKIIEHYRNNGYIDAQVGQPDLEYLDASEDGKSRGLRLRIPIEEGERYRVGAVSFDGNDVINEAGLSQIFRGLEPGDYYSEEYIRTAFDAAREVYGALGYYEMTLFPDLQPRTAAVEAVEAVEAAEDNDNGDGGESHSDDDGDPVATGNGDGGGDHAATGNGDGGGDHAATGNGDGGGDHAATGNGNGGGDHAATGNGDHQATGNGNGDENGDSQFAAESLPTHIDGAPVVDVTIRIQEGEQYFVNRINIVGNRTTHDQVIRRELQLYERGVFNTAGLQHSVRRLNQLGFFEPLEESEVGIEKTEGAEENEVDLTFNLTEANLNQLTFGAGVSQFDGFFGQISFQTSNFLGRGETLGIGIQSGSRVRDINLTFTEPYLFDRNMSGQIGLFSRRIEWLGAYTEDSRGGTATVGFPLALYTRLFLSYSYEATSVTDINPFFFGTGLDGDGFDNPFLRSNPFLGDALLLGNNGRRTVSKITPMISMNTIDHPIFPRRGTRYQAGVDLAGLGGNSRFWKPTLEGTWYIPHTSRTTIGVRAQYQHLAAGNPLQIPIFERLWLGGEYSVRGYDIRRIGPTLSDVDPDIPENSFQGRSLIGGNKSFLFNAEYQFSIADPVRLVVFYDAGQVQNFGDSFAMDDFKTSTGLELRFFIPMLNVPFRLIYAWNPQRDGVYNDRLLPQEETVFRFAVGTTF